MPTPLAHTYYEKLDLEIGWRLPLAKHLEDSLLGILIFYGRTLRALEPADYVLHVIPFSIFLIGRTDHIRLSLLVLRVRAGQPPLR
jgi:hypothetical protein